MKGVTLSTSRLLQESLQRDGYAFVHGAAMQDFLKACGELTDWAAFADSWNALELDGYMADGGRYRRRRHAVYAITAAGGMQRQAHQPHYQTLDYNPLHGGIARWFEPVDPAIGEGASLRAILDFCRVLFGIQAPNVRAWRVEVHQFRIEARAGEPGRPTPEGLHRDGVDYVLVLLISRRNIRSGMTTIHALDGRELGAFTLAEPLDAAVVDDARVAHGVTPVEALDQSEPAYRDVLVVTFADAERVRADSTRA